MIPPASFGEFVWSRPDSSKRKASTARSTRDKVTSAANNTRSSIELLKGPNDTQTTTGRRLSHAGEHVSAAPARHSGALKLLHATLADARITEARPTHWLKDRGAIPVGTRELQCITMRRIEIFLEKWHAGRTQLL